MYSTATVGVADSAGDLIDAVSLWIVFRFVVHENP